MHVLKLSLNEAYDFVRTKKSNISPNFNFMGQLLDFEKTLQTKDCGCSCPKVAVARESKTQDVPLPTTIPASSSSASTTMPSTSGSAVSGIAASQQAHCLCSCHQMKSYFSTPSSTTSNSSSTCSSFSYNNSPTPTT